MKKKDLAARLDTFAATQLAADSHAVRVAKDRYDQAERMLRQAEKLFGQAEAMYRAIETKTRDEKRAERIEADFIDVAKVREVIRFVALSVGVEETSPGRFVGGYEAIMSRVRELLDAEEKVWLLTSFYNLALKRAALPLDKIGLSTRSDVLTVRASFQKIADNENVAQSFREGLRVTLSHNRRTVEAVEDVANMAAGAAGGAAAVAADVGLLGTLGVRK